jgi:hypothetical protein
MEDDAREIPMARTANFHRKERNMICTSFVEMIAKLWRDFSQSEVSANGFIETRDFGQATNGLQEKED